MAISGFTVPWDMINQAIVSIHSYRKKNPKWQLTVFYDDVLVKRKLESVFSGLDYVELTETDPVAALDYVLNKTDDKVFLLLDPRTVCNRPIVDISRAELGDQLAVIRPDRPFELTQFNDGYARLDVRHIDRYMRSKSYFSLGVVVFNTELLREQLTTTQLFADYQRPGCLDRGMPKHYLNRLLAKVKKGLLPGGLNVKTEASLYKVFSAAQCLRHQVRIRHAGIANFSTPKAPWEDAGKIDRLFLQVPYRMYLNVSVPVKDHLDPEFFEWVKTNAKRQIDRFGNFDKAFEEIYDIAEL